MTEGRGIYAGLRVLELGAGAASPVATRYFAEQGATVIRVESSRRPDFLRLLPLPPGVSGGIDAAPMFVLLNPDKRSVSLNLAKPAARALAMRLVDWADVVSENFSPGVMDKWGMGAGRLREIRKELVVVSGCLFGQTGPQRHYPGFGGQGAAIAGFNHVTGWPDGAAVGPYATITDSLAPRYVAVAIAAALWRRRRNGEGCTIDLSQIEAGIYSLSEMIVRESAGAGTVVRSGNADEAAAPHGVYPCRGDDRWLAIAARDDAQWRALQGCIGLSPEADLETLEGRRRRAAEIDERIARWTCDRDAAATMRELQAAGVEAGVVQHFDDLLDDPQLAHRGHFVALAHRHLGEVVCERSALRLSASPGALGRAGPLLGQDNEFVLREVLGLSEAEVEQGVADEVIA